MSFKNGSQSGYTLIELLLVMGIFTAFFIITSMNLLSVRSKTSLGTSVDVLLADLRSQQAKAMSGASANGTSNVNYGIHFLNNSYVLFKSTYSVSDPLNYVVSLDNLKIDTTFFSSEIVFNKGSGEVANFDSSANTIRFSTLGGIVDQKIIIINRLGIVTSVN